MGKSKTPSMADLIDDRQVNVWLGSISASLLLLLTGLGTGQAGLTMAGGTALSLSSVIYMALTVRVFFDNHVNLKGAAR